MFHGLREKMVPWFASQGYSYDASTHGVASDWALDLVAIGFHKPRRFYGHTITNMEQLQHVAGNFVANYLSNPEITPHNNPHEQIGQRSISQKVHARMQQLVGVRRCTNEVSAAGVAMTSIGGVSTVSYDASSSSSSGGGLQGELRLMESVKDVAVISDGTQVRGWVGVGWVGWLVGWLGICVGNALKACDGAS